jgi:NADPH:quinone reductase-like Zn-dependent oxidoreductase
MKAIVYHNYGSPGDALQPQGIDKSKAREKEVLA